MSILIANAGNQSVETIADRNSIAKRHNGMIVHVRDATADPLLGGGRASYMWDSVISQWVVHYSSLKPELVFATEEKVIANGEVATDFIIKDNQVWSAKVLDENDVILGDAKVTASGTTLVLGTTEYDGHKLHYTYAHGDMTAELYDIWNDKIGKTSPAFDGTPTTPTPALGDESTQIANTEFVASTLKSAGFEHTEEGWESPAVEVPEMDTYTLAVASTTAELDLAETQVFTVSAASNRTLTLANTPGAGRTMTTVIKFTGNGGTITWPSNIEWNNGTAPELGAAYTVVVLFWDGSSWVGSVGSTA